MSRKPIAAREVVLNLVEVGKHLEAVERCLQSINATMVVDDMHAEMELDAARRHARALVRVLERFNLSEAAE